MISEIEVEARAHVEAYSDPYCSDPDSSYPYLVDLLKVIDELRAEIARLKTLALDHAIELSKAAIELRALQQYGDERAAAAIKEAAHFIWLRFGVQYEDLSAVIHGT